jgi:polysaccharide export outer membrane protein
MNRIDDMNNSKDGAGKNCVKAWRRSIAIAGSVTTLTGALISTSCQNPHPPTPEQAAAPAAVTLVSGDVVRLTFSGAAELNQSQKIRTDGKVNLPLVGEVDAAGKTVVALQRELAERYKSELKTSTVVVTLESSVTQVVISGAVGRPGRVTFERPTTVFQAIMEAGGVSEFGTLRNVHLVRLIDGQQKTEVLDLRPVTSGRSTKPYYVRDGDVIYVPRTMF